MNLGSWIAIFVFMIASAGLAAYTERQVMALQRTEQNLSDAIISEKRKIRLLQAEWSRLNHPDHLKALSQQYLEKS